MQNQRTGKKCANHLSFNSFLSFLFWACHVTWGILVPQPEIEPVPAAVKGQNPNHWTAREFPQKKNFFFLYCVFVFSLKVCNQKTVFKVVWVSSPLPFQCDYVIHLSSKIYLFVCIHFLLFSPRLANLIY